MIGVGGKGRIVFVCFSLLLVYFLFTYIYILNMLFMLLSCKLIYLFVLAQSIALKSLLLSFLHYNIILCYCYSRLTDLSAFKHFVVY